ncbi:MAG: lysozyme [Rickettsiaceae bacterium]|nr:MAG: lysozyme [Rickettsiaceae bacterium]
MHRLTSQHGINFIKYYEGYKEKPYYCAAGYLTIGYGHKLLAREKYDHVDNKTAHEILQKDLLLSEKAVLKYINAQLTDNQFDALVSFTFNLGPAVLQRSTLRQKINYLSYDEAALEFLKWVRAKGKILNGLVKRRFDESNLFST